MYFGPAIMYSINTVALFVIVISYMISIAPQLTLYTVLPYPYCPLLFIASVGLSTNAAPECRNLIETILLHQESFSGISVIKSYSQTKCNRIWCFSSREQTKNMDLVRVQAWFSL